MENLSTRAIGRLTMTMCIVAIVSIVSLILFFIFGGLWGPLNDLTIALYALMSAALAANVTICVAVLRRLMSWSYRTTMQELNVNAGWRWVCQLYLERVPNFRTIQNREAKLTPKTIGLIHEVVVAWGRKLGVTQGKKLRLADRRNQSASHQTGWIIFFIRRIQSEDESH